MSPLRTHSLVCVALLFFLPDLAASQTVVLPIGRGETLRGQLQSTDPMLSDSTHYDLYLYRGQPGERIIVTMRTGAFDAYLAGGHIEGTEFVSEDTDDDNGGGTDSRLLMVVGQSGSLAIQANSVSNATGDYTLTLDLDTAPARPPVNDLLLPIAAGETVNARFQVSDPKMDDGSHYHLYMFRGTAGQQVVITMRSEDFDAYLVGGSMDGSRFVESESDDDGAGGTDARLTVTLGATGLYVVRANTLEAGETGAYTLTLQVSGAR